MPTTAYILVKHCRWKALFTLELFGISTSKIWPVPTDQLADCVAHGFTLPCQTAKPQRKRERRKVHHQQPLRPPLLVLQQPHLRAQRLRLGPPALHHTPRPHVAASKRFSKRRQSLYVSASHVLRCVQCGACSLGCGRSHEPERVTLRRQLMRWLWSLLFTGVHTITSEQPQRNR